MRELIEVMSAPFRGDEFLDSDAAGAVKDQLIVPVQPARRDRGPYLALRYDFQLAPAVG